MRKQNGITLVSMVIAIVVMLILAGTTITLSINGTLFGKTKEATEKAKELRLRLNDLRESQQKTTEATDKKSDADNQPIYA